MLPSPSWMLKILALILIPLIIVVARNVTWNLPHPDKAYAEWLRVIRPGGLILNYDAEHARNHHNLPQSVHHAHEHVSNELKERCHTIYHMLDISTFTRPQWDIELLTKMGASSVSIDSTVGPRIYAEEDEFYYPSAYVFGESN